MHPIVNNWLKLNEMNEQNLLNCKELISCIRSMLANRWMHLFSDWDIVLEWIDSGAAQQYLGVYNIIPV